MDQASYLKNLSSTLLELSKANILCDTTLIASDREFNAHSVILAAACPTLRSAFQNSPDVKNMYRLELHWLDGNTLESVLFLIYTGILKPSDMDKDDSANLIMTCEQLGLDWIWSQVDLTHNKMSEQESTVENLNKTTGHDFSSTCPNTLPSPNLLSDHLPNSHTMADVVPIDQSCSSDAKESLDFKDFNIDIVKIEGPVISTENNSLCQSVTIKDGNILDTCVGEICDKAFSEVEQLEVSRHQSEHLMLSCGYCDRRFKYPAALKKHYKLHHTQKDSTSAVCHVCGVVSNELRTHLTEAHGEASEISSFCDQCDAVFGDKAELERHFKDSHADEQQEKLFVCSHCWKSFKDKSQLKKHLLVHESGKDFVCELCSRSFAQEYYLKKHIRTHSESLDHTCPTCGKQFKLIDYLRVHQRGHCGGEETEDSHGSTASATGHLVHMCSICDRRFSHLSYLKKHMRTHTGEKPYECVTCKKRFKDNCIQQHMLTHSAERPYACQKCDRRFLRHADLQAHVRTHSGAKSHWCTHCVQGFHKKGDLHRHLRIHTGERPYICETCGKSFKILFHLTLHAAVHSNDRPHKCDKCERAFPSAVRLKKHAFIHTGQRPYVCPVCNREFNRQANMKCHQKTHDEKPARPRCATASENGDFEMMLDTKESLAETLAKSENVEIVYCKMEPSEVLVALPIDTLQKYAL